MNAAWLPACLALGTLGGCSLLFDAEGPRCETLEDCAPVDDQARLCTEEGRCVPKSMVHWGCVIDPAIPVDFARVELMLTVSESTEGMMRPMASQEVLGCVSFDLSCVVGELFVTDETGTLNLRQITRHGYYTETIHSRTGYAPSITQFGPFPDHPLGADYSIHVKRWSDHGHDGPELPDPDPNLAHIEFFLSPCPGETSADGAVFSIGDFGGSGFGPYHAVEDGTLAATGASGRATYRNIDIDVGELERAPVPIVATDIATGNVIAVANVVVRPGAVTSVYLDPVRNFSASDE